MLKSQFEVKAKYGTPEEVARKNMIQRATLLGCLAMVAMGIILTITPWPYLGVAFVVLAGIGALVTPMIHIPNTLEELVRYDNERLEGYKHTVTDAVLKGVVHDKQETYKVVFSEGDEDYQVYLNDCMYAGYLWVDPAKQIYKYGDWAFVVDAHQRTAQIFERP